MDASNRLPFHSDLCLGIFGVVLKIYNCTVYDTEHLKSYILRKSNWHIESILSSDPVYCSYHEVDIIFHSTDCWHCCGTPTSWTTAESKVSQRCKDPGRGSTCYQGCHQDRFERKDSHGSQETTDPLRASGHACRKGKSANPSLALPRD